VQVVAAAATPWTLGLLARAHALLEPEGSAEALHAEAVDRLGRTPVVTDLARAHLLYCEWLHRRRADAATRLELAHHMFLDLDASAFAERTRRDLVATGVSGHACAAPNMSALTRPGNPRSSRSWPAGRPLRGSDHNVHQPQHRRLSPPENVPELGISSRRQLRHLPDR
jgi:hypothetical protein